MIEFRNKLIESTEKKFEEMFKNYFMKSLPSLKTISMKFSSKYPEYLIKE